LTLHLLKSVLRQALQAALGVVDAAARVIEIGEGGDVVRLQPMTGALLDSALRVRFPRHPRILSETFQAAKVLRDAVGHRYARSRALLNGALPALLSGFLPPLRGKDRMGGRHDGPDTPPFLTFPRKGGRDLQR